ncbi:MAG TPA: SRPBCC domain-containing protein [Actinophytocola sp.]|uniref:SRPBCC domain-containing protein n=1 Tax=Actinophytocola sp. TaxID=1872138 RepID=UPI002DDCBA3F|nr:SRPBCC domain-containing protein [Actinophytocola sp.]HEV2778864.1 SRPBCC domain-containing protein [Actinophytocola sp.]
MTEPMTLRARVLAPAARVRRALTDPAELRTWLAEHAEVELPHRYEFWGRYTPHGDAPRQRLLHVDDHTLRFGWRVEDTDTTVDIGLEAERPGSTIVVLRHSGLPDFAEMMAQTGPLSLLHTFWALAIANLVDHVEGRALTARVDLTSPLMRAEVVIDASPRAVYDSLVDPEVFARWFGAKIEIEPHVGGRWAMGGFELDESPAKILELEPGRSLSIGWSNGLVASWELADSGGRTRLTLVQSGFDESNPPHDAWLGWLSGIAELRRYHELTDWRPTWLGVHLDGMPDGLITLPQEV